jgi:hypothetical protein
MMPLFSRYDIVTRFRAIGMAMIVFLCTGCSPKPLIIAQIGGLVDEGVVAFESDADWEMVEMALPANIKLFEALLANSPSDRQLLTLLSRLYGSYAFGFVETRLEAITYSSTAIHSGHKNPHLLKEQVNRYYQKGLSYALQALELRLPGAAKAFAKPATIASYLEQLAAADVPALYWYGFNLGAWANQNLDSMRAVSKGHVARQIMQRVVELAPDYHGGGAHLLLMVYFGGRSSMMGGSQAAARDHYQQLQALTAADDRLPDLFYARYCLVQQQDRAAFVTLMQSIVDQPPVDGDRALYNAIAARRAAIYLSSVDRFFD